MTDLANLDTVAACEAGAEIELRHPVNGQPLGVFWGIKGRDSKAFRDAMRGQINSRVAKRTAPTPDESDAEGLALLVACSTSWRTVGEDAKGSGAFLVDGGKRLEFSAANASAIMSRFPWIRRQVDEAIIDLANFIKA